MMCFSRILAVVVLCLTVTPMRGAVGQSSESVLEFTRTLTPEQIRAAGLDKLSQSELDVLNRAARVYAIAVARLAATPGDSSAPGAPGAPASAIVESRIDGEFTGWEPEAIFKLVNGQIWQQATYTFRNQYIRGPKVLIYRSGGDYRMRIDGVDGEITVRRLK